MTRQTPGLLACVATLSVVLGGCGQQIEVAEKDPQGPVLQGAILFNQRCSGCHTLDAAASQGSRSARRVSGGDRTDGPNFNTRRESEEDVLFALQNGGFSGATMPANIVVGEDARKVAKFVAEYAGRKTPDSSNSGGDPTTR